MSRRRAQRLRGRSRQVAVRYVAAFYGKVGFPEDTPESNALAILRQGDTAHFCSIILYPELLMVIISRGEDAKPEYCWYPPDVRFSPKDLLTKALPLGNGLPGRPSGTGSPPPYEKKHTAAMDANH